MHSTRRTNWGCQGGGPSLGAIPPLLNTLLRAQQPREGATSSHSRPPLSGLSRSMASATGLRAARAPPSLLGARPPAFLPYQGLHRAPTSLLGHAKCRASLRCGPLRAGRGSKLQASGCQNTNAGQAQQKPFTCRSPRASSLLRTAGARLPGSGVQLRCDVPSDRAPSRAQAASACCRRRQRRRRCQQLPTCLPPCPAGADCEQALGGARGAGPVQPGQ